MQAKQGRLNKGQLEVLNLLFKYRFGTSELIAKIQGRQNGTAIRSRLTILRERGLIGRHYQPSDKLEGRHAAYYLFPDGLRELVKNEVRSDIPDSVSKSIYKNRSVSRQFIDHCLAVFNASAQLKLMYGNSLKIFTKSELASFEYFPKPLPDGFVSLKHQGEAKRFFLNVIDTGTPSFVLQRQLKQFAEYYESGEWEATESEFPAILFICPGNAQEKKLLKRRGAVSEDLRVCTTNETLLASAQSRDDNIWLEDLDESRKSLKEL